MVRWESYDDEESDDDEEDDDDDNDQRASRLSGAPSRGTGRRRTGAENETCDVKVDN